MKKKFEIFDHNRNFLEKRIENERTKREEQTRMSILILK